ncbi:MAG: type I-U CRISPR-associated protein Cas5/Cas6 [Rhodothermaceae bacterium]|nr:type I-U CRISPR-associated protein Cas5/Cas6 [Rhodothermaceae bacterium]MXX58612.1 type I-U CRISPR-associated protein Cas5/Cas6 [Rhodothermaceae bacterium]MYD19690.1 type I-U CRISPR-associated protein Cas5/Cas6 [Rhodothermaceae bacterium]MYD56532.1 type I-U CRISPR-associated protein Cas5/Cas6 [Rhodothermaceae bacterium]MYJ56371.1 type I-U CRISPR-associated protein Cas5/Cas6 [Rhodothermaceae bacterium]
MFGLSFRFLSGRYHATPWGRNVNEADVAWPPEPWRIIRAFIASYWRKGDWHRWSRHDLTKLVHALAEDLPVFYLPQGCVHAHTRHYMPIRKGKSESKTLVFDAFLHIPSGEKILVIWKDVKLDDRLMSLAEDLASSIGYLGRSESWTECSVLKHWDGQENCGPMEMGFTGEEVSLLVPCSAESYQVTRNQLLVQEKQRIRAEASKIISERVLLSKVQKIFYTKDDVDTLPACFLDALSLENTDLRRLRWHRPPAALDVIYARDPSTSPRVVPQVISRRKKFSKVSKQVTIARFVLAGRPRPRLEVAVKIGEIMRKAALSQFGWQEDELNGKRLPLAPWQISGRREGRFPINDPSHPHAFWLPEDADGDGLIDHIIVSVSSGMDPHIQSRLERITRIWLASRDSKGSTDGEEWRLALEGYGQPQDFAGSSRLLGRSKQWRSVTPFLSAGHLKKNGYSGEVLRLFKRQGMETDGVKVTELREINVGSIKRHALHFHRFRSRGRVPQPDSSGTFLKIEFPYTVQGPLAIGFASHFGLGTFGAI